MQIGDVVMGQDLQESSAALLEGIPVATVTEGANQFPALLNFCRLAVDSGIQAGIAEWAGDLFQFCGGHFIVKKSADAIFAVGFDAADQLLQAQGEWRELRVSGLQLFELQQPVVEFVEPFLIEEQLEGLDEGFQLLAAIDQGLPEFIAEAFRDFPKELFGGVVVLLLFDEFGGLAEIFFGECPQVVFGDGNLWLEAVEF